MGDFRCSFRWKYLNGKRRGPVNACQSIKIIFYYFLVLIFLSLPLITDSFHIHTPQSMAIIQRMEFSLFLKRNITISIKNVQCQEGWRIKQHYNGMTCKRQNQEKLPSESQEDDVLLT